MALQIISRIPQMKHINNIENIIKSELHKLNQIYFGALGLKGILAVSIVSRREILKINWKYRGKMKSTDILSFPSTTSVKEHETAVKEQFLNEKVYGKSWPVQFGHLIICPPVIFNRFPKLLFPASKCRLTLKLRKYLVHGFAHLGNLDHHSGEEFKIMRNFENYLKGKLYE